MLLNCPHCATIYSVDPAVIGENGRSLRCARCATVWFATRSQELVFATASAAVVANAEPTPSVAANPNVTSIAESPRTDIAPPENISNDRTLPLAPTAPGGAHPLGAATPPTDDEDVEILARRRAQRTKNRAGRLHSQFGLPTVIAVLAVLAALIVAWRIPIVQRVPQLASFYATVGLPVNLRDLVFRDVKTSSETRDGVPVLLVEGTIVSTGRTPVEVPRLRFALRDGRGQEIYSWSAIPDQSTLQPGASLPFRSRLATPPSEGKEVVVRFFNKRDAMEGVR